MPEKKETQAVEPIIPAPAAKAAPSDKQENGEEERKPSKIFLALSRLMHIFLLASLGVALFLSALTLDFLNIYTFRHRIPEEWRKTWPFEPYFDFVQLHQLPEEERYQQLMLQEQERFNRLITQGSRDLEARAKALEDSYRGLIRSQKEQYTREMEELRKLREELALEQKKFADEKADLDKRKAAIDELSNRLASETLNLESSLIRFMEQENRLDQVRSIAAQMEPKALSTIFDEVPDDKLIYEILSGLNPQHSGKVLGFMDPEKAGKIMKIGQQPLALPTPGPSRTYVPPSLQNLIDDTQAKLR
jgi:flagellar motility protein MotE (MotC chaperone)